MSLSPLLAQPVAVTEARASFYVFVNIHFLELPDAQFSSNLREAEFRSVLEVLRQSNEVHREITTGASLMSAFLHETRDLEQGELVKRLGLDRTRLYRGISPEYGPIPPYEALWTGKRRDSLLLQELARTYREGGFILKADIQERPDYIGIQLHYLERLLMKEISAREAKNEVAAQAALNEEKEFLQEHVGTWLSDFVASALEHAQTDFYRGHLHMLRGFIEQERKMLGSL